MKIVNCTICNRAFQAAFGQKNCDPCTTKVERSFRTIKEYIELYPDAGVPEIANEADVPQEIVLNLLRTGKLELSRKAPAPLTCERCDAPTYTGKYCETCASKMHTMLTRASSDLQRCQSSQSSTQRGRTS